MTWRPLTLSAGLAAGVSLGLALAGPASIDIVPALPAGGVCLALVILWQVHRQRTGRGPYAADGYVLFLAALAVGALSCHHAIEEHLARQLPPDWHGRDVLLTGYIVERPRHAARMTRIDVAVTRLVPLPGARGIDHRLPPLERVQLSWYGRVPPLAVGDHWQWVVRLRAIRGLANPGGTDAARWLFLQGIDARGYVRDRPLAPQRLGAGETASDGAAPAARWRLWQQGVRADLADRLTALPSAGRHTGILQALALGLTDDLADADRQVFRDTGTAHLLAISGLHIGLAWWFGQRLVSLLWTLFARVCPNRLPARQGVADALALPIAAAYAWLAGFALPTRRALVMLAVVVLARHLQRPLAHFSASWLALALLLAWQPLLLADAGLWLSFSAVLTLVYLGSGRTCATPDAGGAGRFRRVLSAFGIHLALGVALVPVTAYFFRSASLVAPLANLFAVPVFSLLLVPLALAAVALLPAWPAAADRLVALAEWLLSVTMAGLSELAQPAYAAITVTLPGVLLLVATLAALVLALLPRGTGLRWLALPLCLPLLSANLVSRAVSGVEVHVLDVGQGLAVLVYTARHTVLFDTGGPAGIDSTAFERTVLPALAAQGRQRIDLLVLSHADDDHAAGAALARQRFPTMETIASVPSDAGVTACRAGLHREFDGVSVDILHPAAGDDGSENDRSCVLLIRHGASRVLLAGDIELTAERRLVQRIGEPLAVDLLLAPHHGSRSSSSEAFVEAFPTDHVVYAAGADNRFGFPHDSVQMRYKLSGATAYRTGSDGAISFWLGPTGLSRPPRRYRFSGWRFWQGSEPAATTATARTPSAEASSAVAGTRASGR